MRELTAAILIMTGAMLSAVQAFRQRRRLRRLPGDVFRAAVVGAFAGGVIYWLGGWLMWWAMASVRHHS